MFKGHIRLLMRPIDLFQKFKGMLLQLVDLFFSDIKLLLRQAGLTKGYIILYLETVGPFKGYILLLLRSIASQTVSKEIICFNKSVKMVYKAATRTSRHI